MPKAKILVTGACGYIGSHTIVELLENGYDVVCLDSLINSTDEVLKGIYKITGKLLSNIKIDLAKDNAVDQLLTHCGEVDGIIHFAALKAVSESVEFPLWYYDNNIKSLLNILQFINKNHIKAFVFSSSCTVYGNTNQLPVHENLPFNETNSPYGRSKQMCEQIIKDFFQTSENQQAISLRYFNPAGAHRSYHIGELPINPPMNLVPIITETAIGIRDKIIIHGNNYQTRDGTCIRDYIHVMDLARAHSLALKKILNNEFKSRLDCYNLGIGNGVSVLEAIEAFEKSTGIKLKYEIGPRRPGDIPAIYADNSKIKNELSWTPQYNIHDIMIDAWRWQQNISSHHK